MRPMLISSGCVGCRARVENPLGWKPFKFPGDAETPGFKSLWRGLCSCRLLVASSLEVSFADLTLPIEYDLA